MPVSITSSVTCPPGCAMGADCYGKFHHLLVHWNRVDVSGDDWELFCAQVRSLPAGIPWRHNEVGDLPGVGNVIDHEALELLMDSNLGKKGFTYTHKPVSGRVGRANGEAVERANARGFVVNLSADNLADADKKASLGIAPVTVVLPYNTTCKSLETPAGRAVTICPHHFDPRIQCWFCGLCALGNRPEIIGFPAHGAGRKRITERLPLMN